MSAPAKSFFTLFCVVCAQNGVQFCAVAVFNVTVAVTSGLSPNARDSNDGEFVLVVRSCKCEDVDPKLVFAKELRLFTHYGAQEPCTRTICLTHNKPSSNGVLATCGAVAQQKEKGLTVSLSTKSSAPILKHPEHCHCELVGTLNRFSSLCESELRRDGHVTLSSVLPWPCCGRCPLSRLGLACCLPLQRELLGAGTEMGCDGWFRGGQDFFHRAKFELTMTAPSTAKAIRDFCSAPGLLNVGTTWQLETKAERLALIPCSMAMNT